MIKYHETKIAGKIAEILPDSDMISSPEEMLDIMATEGYNGCHGIILHENNLHRDFFDLKTGLAGEILQKFSNYRMRLAVIGDFTDIKSKSLRDFIRESNTWRIISFVDTLDAALSVFDRK